MRCRNCLILVLLCVFASNANAAIVTLAGPDGTGFLSFSNIKNFSGDPAPGTPFNPTTQTLMPYYFDPVLNRYIAIAAGPLSAGSTYAEEASYTVLNKSITQSDFATMSAGEIGYNPSLITGIGTEIIGVGNLSLNFNTFNFNGITPSGFNTNSPGFISPFSPIHTPYNTGSGFGNFGWAYDITASNVTGTGLTFHNGVLTSIDLTSNINVAVKLGNSSNPFLRFGNSLGGDYQGTFSIINNQYAFNLDETATVSSPLGTLTNTRMVFNRSGSIAGVTAVPEPSSLAFLGIAGCSAWYLRRRRGQLNG